MFILIFEQLLKMFFIMLLAFICYKIKLVDQNGNRSISNLLLMVVNPLLIITVYQDTEYNPDMVSGLLLAFAAALAAHILEILISTFLIRPSSGPDCSIERFNSMYSNCGFIGIPLVEMTFNDSMAVFYVSSFVALLNILQWTYGIVVMTGKKDSIALKKITTNPIIISFLLGILFFFLPVELPEVLDSAVAAIASMNAPVAMIILGIYLAQMKLRDLFTDRAVYLCALMRLIVIPLATAAVLALIPGNEMLKMSVLIVAATPVGSNVAIFAQMEGLDHTQAVKDICLSTVLCIATIPVVVTAAGVIL